MTTIDDERSLMTLGAEIGEELLATGTYDAEQARDIACDRLGIDKSDDPTTNANLQEVLDNAEGEVLRAYELGRTAVGSAWTQGRQLISRRPTHPYMS